MTELLEQELSNQILGAAFNVHTAMGPGLLESAYESGMVIELKYRGITVERQKAFPLFYRGQCAATYVADLVIADKVILELKSVSALLPLMEAQLLNYLRLSKLPIGYLMNFNGTRLVWRRFVCQR